MKTKILVVLGLLMGFASTSPASPKEDVEKVANSFYAQYDREVLRKPAKGDSDKALIQWVASNPAVSDAFKAALKKAVVDARKHDPELGLEADPIIDAQDNPEKGYRAKDIKITGDKAQVLMQGVGAPDFKVSVSLVSVGGKWKIDGIGPIHRSQK